MFGPGIELLLYAIWILEGEFMASSLLLNLNLPLSQSELLKSSKIKKETSSATYILLGVFSVCTLRPSISAHKREAASLVTYCEKANRVHKPPAADIQCSAGKHAGFSLSRTTDEENGPGHVPHSSTPPCSSEATS